jgi:hypothetical protein
MDGWNVVAIGGDWEGRPTIDPVRFGERLRRVCVCESVWGRVCGMSLAGSLWVGRSYAFVLTYWGRC